MTTKFDSPVDFLVIGAQKAGTTAFRHYLNLHPQIKLHVAPEPHFFDDEAAFDSDIPDYAEYHSGFPPISGDFKRGEVTPIYMYWKPAIRRIYDYNPQIRLIAILRNPIERAFSGWTMESNRLAESLSFYDALMAEVTRFKTLTDERRVHFYVERGKYCEQIRRIWRYFDKSQFLILRSEDLKENPRHVMSRVCEFLQIGDSCYRKLEPICLRVGKYTRKMDNRSKKYLQSVFESEIRDLEKLLDWDLSAWLK